MKKNLRIVSAAAAALLAVAPVAATVVPAASTTVSAASDSLAPTTKVQTTEGNVWLYTKDGDKYVATYMNGDNAQKLTLSKGTALTITGAAVKHAAIYDGSRQIGNEDLYPVSYQGKTLYVSGKQVKAAAKPATKPADSASSSIVNNSSSIFYGDVNTTVNISAVAQNGNIPGAASGNITATVNGKSYTAMLHTTDGSKNNVTFRPVVKEGNKVVAVGPDTPASKLQARTEYEAFFHDVRFNLGNENAGKSVKFVLPDGAYFVSNNSRTKTVNVNSDGVASVGEIVSTFYAYDATDMKGLNFYAKKTGEQVKSGSLTMHAVNGQLNVESLYAAMNYEYGAFQVFDDKNSVPTKLTPINDIRDQLKKQNIDVDPNGYFKAPATLNLEMHAKSNANGATATLPVTVTVDNATPSVAQETTKTVKIMHIATIYDKNGKATHEPALRAYNTVSVVSDPVTLKDEKGKDAGKFYKLAGKDQYIKVGNVDGTSRSLKHNSYVYKSTGKRRGKTVLKKGSSVTTYGKSFMIAGHQMYRIGENKYVKKANF